MNNPYLIKPFIFSKKSAKWRMRWPVQTAGQRWRESENI